MCGLRVQIMRQNICIIWHPYSWDLGKILYLAVSRSYCLQWDNIIFLLGSFEDWLVKPFNMYKQCLTLNNSISRYYILEKEYCKALFFSHAAGNSGNTIEIKWKKKNSTRITLYDYTIQLLFLKKKLTRCHIFYGRKDH